MKIISSLYFCLLFFSFSNAQTEEENTSTIPFIAYWDIGDHYTFNVIKIKKSWTNDKLKSEKNHSYIADFKVIDATESTYTISWSYNIDLSTLGLSLKEIPQKLQKSLEKIKQQDIIYTTTETGEFIEIINWKEISKNLKQSYKTILEFMDTENTLSKDVLNNVLNIFSSKEAIELLLFKEVQYVHYPLGYEYPINESLQFEEELPNLFGGKPIKANGNVYVESYNPEDRLCKFKQVVSIDQEDAKRVIYDFFKQLDIPNNKFEEFSKKSFMDITEITDFEYYNIPGIPEKITYEKNISIEMNNKKSSRLEKVIIQLIDFSYPEDENTDDVD